MSNPTAPSGWGLSQEEINRLAQDAVGEPDPADNAWRPAGGSLLGGVGQCLYDEIKVIIDITKILWDINRDMDIAADGEDNWEVMRSHSRDSVKVATLFYQLQNGSVIFDNLPREQRMALFRLYAKQEMVKDVLRTLGKTGLNMIAAYDTYWSNYELMTLNQSENLLKGLADAISLFFTDAEWAEMAQGGKALADQVTKLVEEQVKSDPWGSAGYAACLVALFLSPTKIVKALRPLLSSLRGLARATDTAALARILRANRVNVPDWLGGNNGPDVGDAARTAENAEDVGDAVTDANKVDDQVDTTDPVETAEDAQPEPIRDPEEVEAPEPTRDTSNVPRTKRIGDHAEADARARLQADGYQTYEITNSSGHGTDILAVKQTPDGPDIRVIEVKANGSRLNDGQQLGGESHFRSVLNRYNSGQNRTWEVLQHAGQGNPPRSMNLNQMLRRAQISSDDLGNARYELWKYDNVDPDMPGPVSPPKTTNWSSGTNANQFDLDANGNRIQYTKTRRDWETPGQRPE